MAAAKKKMAMKTMGAKAHGWEGKSGKGKPPFVGAAPPIHLHHGGKYLKPKKKGK